MDLESNPPEKLSMAALTDRLETSLLTLLADVKPKRRKRLRRAFRAVQRRPATDPEARATNRAYFKALFRNAKHVRRLLKKARARRPG